MTGKKLDEYTENIEYITVAKEQLEQDYADLENMKANVESQKQSVSSTDEPEGDRACRHHK